MKDSIKSILVLTIVAFISALSIYLVWRLV